MDGECDNSDIKWLDGGEMYDYSKYNGNMRVMLNNAVVADCLEVKVPNQ